jgi:hypothetical protein
MAKKCNGVYVRVKKIFWTCFPRFPSLALHPGAALAKRVQAGMPKHRIGIAPDKTTLSGTLHVLPPP